MKKLSFREDSRFTRFIMGKGFYAVLAVCLLAIGGAVLAGISSGLFDSESTKPNTSATEQARPVEKPVTGQPDDRTTTTTTATSTVTTAPTTAAPTADLYVLPFGNLVGAPFSDGEPVYSATMGDWRLHTGADFVGEIGDVVKALADGKVTEVAEDPMWGTVMIVDHGLNVISRYCGVKASVTPGTTVSVGDTIGTLMEIPCESADAPHLHLEMTVDGRLVNPVEALGREVRYAADEEN